LVLFASLGRDRFVLFSSPRCYFLAEVWVSPCGDAVVPPFSGKVCKSLLIKGNSKLLHVFEGKGLMPKPIRVSPLGYGDTYLWIRSDDRGRGLLTVSAGEEYFFYVGFDESVSHMVFNALEHVDGVEVFNVKWRLLNVKYFRENIPSKNPRVRLNDAESVVVEFKSPVNLIDPFKKTRFKRFIPLAGTVFAYNIGEISRILQRNTYYWQLVNLVNTVLRETSELWETLRKTHYIYEGKKIPGLIGEVEYTVDRKTLEENREAKTLIENILTHAQIMGVGSGRANGFGHVTVKTR